MNSLTLHLRKIGQEWQRQALSEAQGERSTQLEACPSNKMEVLHKSTSR